MKGVQDPGSTPGISTEGICNSALSGDDSGFDWAMSKDMDNRVGDDPKSSKTRKCKRIYKWYC